ncbi:GNAT family N-acetyltransferase [bacterium]|nr:GNAT family N-acetyltransferase [bacterium]
MSKYSLRSYEKGDEDNILELFKRVFGKNRTREEWNWRFKENPAGKSIIEVARDGDRIIGHYSVSPAKFLVQGSEYIGMQEIDLMVSPDYIKGLKKAGVFIKLGKKLYENVEKAGIKFTFGFPNQNSSPIGSKLLGWKAVAEIPLYSLYLTTKLIKEKIKTNPLKRFLAILLFKIYFTCCKLVRSLILRRCMAIEKIDHFDERAEVLWQDNGSKYDIAIIRNSEYLNWRFFQHPLKEYTVYGIFRDDNLAGYIALKTIISDSGGIKEGLIVDLFAEMDNSSVVKLLLVKAIDYFEKWGCDVIRGWMMPEYFYNSPFIQLGFKRASSQITLYINTMGKDPAHEKLQTSRWYIQMADSDGV